eukprot:TRINITY_DN476288_c0_g2_i1.p1 TRINITY_DN476288_c0_g2~~TRINITY_DN476288_c0_g2_i1.p1  ORF type:complete len:180 (-),score=28.43 TRINITY_DN476288_c0_g2_i1:7-546(-)
MDSTDPNDAISEENFENPEFQENSNVNGTDNKFICNGCGNSIGSVRYKCSTCANYDLCSFCKDSSVVTENHSTEHMLIEVLLDETSPHIKRKWTLIDMLNLLTGIEMFGFNFTKVAQHVKTKSKGMCKRRAFGEGSWLNVGPEEFFEEVDKDLVDNLKQQISSFENNVDLALMPNRANQ